MVLSKNKMSFAEKQLAKYGWKKGMGLGKSNDGIAVPIAVKPRINKLGVGNDPAKPMTHWWDLAYNKAINNIKVSRKQDGSVEVSQKKACTISKSRPNIFKSNILYDNFQQKGTLTGNEFSSVSDNYSNIDQNGCSMSNENQGKTNNNKNIVHERSNSSSDEDTQPGVRRGNGLLLDMTDDQLLRLCEGRTAHKGARHGITMSGKMKRLEQMQSADESMIARWGKNEFKAKTENSNSAGAVWRPMQNSAVTNTLKTKTAIGYSYVEDGRKNGINKAGGKEESINEVCLSEDEKDSTLKKKRSKSKKKERKCGDTLITNFNSMPSADDCEVIDTVTKKGKNRRKKNSNDFVAEESSIIVNSHEICSLPDEKISRKKKHKKLTAPSAEATSVAPVSSDSVLIIKKKRKNKQETATGEVLALSARESDTFLDNKFKQSKTEAIPMKSEVFKTEFKHSDNFAGDEDAFPKKKKRKTKI